MNAAAGLALQITAVALVAALLVAVIVAAAWGAKGGAGRGGGVDVERALGAATITTYERVSARAEGKSGGRLRHLPVGLPQRLPIYSVLPRDGGGGLAARDRRSSSASTASRATRPPRNTTSSIVAQSPETSSSATATGSTRSAISGSPCPCRSRRCTYEPAAATLLYGAPEMLLEMHPPLRRARQRLLAGLHFIMAEILDGTGRGQLRTGTALRDLRRARRVPDDETWPGRMCDVG
ncbi:hypothetical protein HU200_010803 [Digitaria exilis]|uniref:Uncharacterized protein n=1 Tax=Digitaria exilis TaxID=1010633 RepID=A0A835FIC4_9POAL|nr:hypothetical protein HU200_010803 [Digitaria exilis]